jgi:hypothetical protein
LICVGEQQRPLSTPLHCLENRDHFGALRGSSAQTILFMSVFVRRGGSLAKPQADIRRWALIGAEHRLVQLAEEAAAIHRAFPELREGTRRTQGGRRGTKASGDNPGPRKRRKMSAAARKRISEAQKARWRKQKAGASKKT